MKLNSANAIKIINKKGILLVFPILNKSEPESLWSEFFPGKKMAWEWNEDSDDSVANMWHLMKRLSDCGDVVYTKWFRNRATFFSKELFTAGLKLMTDANPKRHLSTSESLQIYETLEINSPLSTKEIKAGTDLRGKENETIYNRAMKELFSQMLIVAFGEVEDGAFPSLAVGSTESLFEDIWKKSMTLSSKKAGITVEKFMPEGSVFRKYFSQILSEAAAA